MATRTLNCRYYDGETWLWLPAAGMYRIRRASGDTYLIGQVTEPEVWNFVHAKQLTCSCDHYFFTNLRQGPGVPHICRHLRLVLLALSRLHLVLTDIPRHNPSQPGPLSADQHRQLLDWASEPLPSET